MAENNVFILREYFEKMPIMAYNISLDGKILDCNKKALQTLGYKSKKALIGKNISRIYAPSSQKKAKKLFKKWKKTGRLVNEEIKVRKKNGKILDVLLNVNTINDARSKPLYSLSTQINITDLKKAERILEEKEESHRTLVENIPDIIARFNKELKCTFINNTLKKELGVEPRLFIGKRMSQIVDKKTALESDKNMRKVFRTGMPSIQFLTIPTIEGKKHYFAKLLPEKTKDGKVRSVLTITRDITEQKLYEDALRESENRFRELFKNMSGCVAIYEAKNNGKDFIFKDFNKSAERVEKIKREEVVGRSVKKVFPGIINFGLFKVFQKVWRTGKPTQHPVSLYKDERIVGWRNNYVYKLPSGEIVAIYYDVTKQKQAEQELKKSEEKFKSLFEEAFDLVFVADVKTRKLVDCNKKALKVTGYSRKEILSMNADDLHPKEVLKETMEAFKKQARRELKIIDTLLLTKKGKRIPVSISTTLIKRGDKDLLVGVFRDITERRKAEKKLRNTVKQLNVLLSDKDVLLREIHHRVKNNMQIISSMLNLQLEHVKDKKIKELLEESQHRIRLMAFIHEQLYKSNNLTNINLKVYLKGLAEYLFNSYGVNKKRINLKMRIENVSFNIETSILCGLIVNELLSNSLKYAFPNNRKGKINIMLRQKNKYYELCVCDNGIGLPEDINVKKPKTLGIELVNIFTKQLSGKLIFDKRKGTRVSIMFKTKKGGV